MLYLYALCRVYTQNILKRKTLQLSFCYKIKVQYSCKNQQIRLYGISPSTAPLEAVLVNELTEVTCSSRADASLERLTSVLKTERARICLDTPSAPWRQISPLGGVGRGLGEEGM